MNPNDIFVRSHEGGFYSCCSLRLHYLIEYYNYFKKIPVVYDCKGFFSLYKKKDRKNDEITFDYFKHYNDVNDVIIKYNGDIDYKEHYQYKKFHKLEYEKLKPFIHKYFSPNDEILNIKKTIQEKYNIDYDNI